ncbi:MAG: aspartate kinase [Gammaproteobacteria bacterium]|nr:aspartate kinase [Gammaproteobacteria bacterium]
MSLIIQKYGGTSVGSVARIHAVAEQIAKLADEGHRVAVVVSAMGDTTDRLVELAHEVCPEPDPREMDALLATGEMVSTALLAMALRRLGRPARSYNAMQLPIATTAQAGRARIVRVEAESLQNDLRTGIVPIVTGFQGCAANGDLTTIGRGGSDTTAVALAVALVADECQILSDVAGVYTTDPRMVPEAKRLPRISYEEMLELAGQGSRVLHLRCVEFAARYGMKLRVLSSFEAGPGTLICQEDRKVEAPVVSGIAFNRDEASITVGGLPHKPGMAYAMLKPISEAAIDVDMIVVNTPDTDHADFSFTVHRNDYSKAIELTRVAAHAFPGAAVTGNDRVAKLAVVGSGMRSQPGVATTLFETLAKEAINVRLVSTSEIKISVLVAEKDLERAVRALHQAYGLERKPSP